MRSKTSLIVLISLSLCGFSKCQHDDMPVMPPFKSYTPILISTESGYVDWQNSYFFGVLDSEPNNPNHHERAPLFQFLSGNEDQEKPRCVSNDSYLELKQYNSNVQDWAKDNCSCEKIKEN